jgi:hypothetical protein
MGTRRTGRKNRVEAAELEIDVQRERGTALCEFQSRMTNPKARANFNCGRCRPRGSDPRSRTRTSISPRGRAQGAGCTPAPCAQPAPWACDRRPGRARSQIFVSSSAVRGPARRCATSTARRHPTPPMPVRNPAGGSYYQRCTCCGRGISIRSATRACNVFAAHEQAEHPSEEPCAQRPR